MIYISNVPKSNTCLHNHSISRNTY
ncbi:hypothetical protein F383_19308 [Gossypium arboreum]|uniref:Uncharacterized protein n=1 Tax=Gossypium arboreum TaxID=29729 RepID=A0A0B0NLX4_GOSAR|nr:hypothetical protein F383_19308 [Gossypium arboreum]